MNIFSIFSFLIGTAVIYTGLYLSSPKMHLYMDFTAVFIVFGGTLAATAISFHLNKIFSLFAIFLKRSFKSEKHEVKKLVRELILAIEANKKGKSIAEIQEISGDYFFKEALSIVQDGILSQEEIVQVLNDRNDNLAESYMAENKKMKVISKYPPAFGMIGTTIGMIVLLDGLGGEDAMKTIGPAMGVCLITTLYGAVLANMILIPISENLTEGTMDMHFKNRIIIEAVELFLQKANPIFAAEKLNSFLNPGERLDWKDVLEVKVA